MDALIAKADAIQPLAKKRKFNHKESPPKASTSTTDLTEVSVGVRTKVPKSLRPSSPTPESARSYNHIKDKKLRTHLSRQSAASARSKALLKDADLLLTEDAGKMEVEDEMERTWRVGQKEIAQGAGAEAAKGRREFVLDGGPYAARYSRNGRHLAIAGRHGHVSTFDWQTGALHAELQLGETCRDITFLHDQSHFAVAQKKYVYIYDKNGVELHRLANHIEPTHLEFLPYHWLLASVGNAGYLKYQDTSTGQLLIEHRTKLGATSCMTQNAHSAVIHLGHQNGTVTLWTPNLPHPAVRLLAHLGPVASVAVDASSAGRYMATAGVDGRVKVWDCRNWKGAVREWGARAGQASVEWSARGYLTTASGGTVNVYAPPAIKNAHPAKVAPPLYLTHPIPHRPLSSLRFCPFQDILTIGHASGLSNILVPGAGEPNFDSTEADPFENAKARREREVKGLLDKIQPDLIALDPDFVGSLAPEPKLSTAVSGPHDIPFARLPRLERLRVQGKADETEDMDAEGYVDPTGGGEGKADGDGEEGDGGRRLTKEEKEKKKMRGKSKSMKRYLRKQRKNVIDPTAVAIRKKLERQKEERQRTREAAANGGIIVQAKPSALDRFKRPTK